MIDRIDILASGYFVDELDKGESEELMDLIGEPALKERFEWFRNNWEDEQEDVITKFNIKRAKDLTADMIQKVEPGFTFSEAQPNISSSGRVRRIVPRKMISIAASLAIIVASAITLNTLLKRTKDSDLQVKYSEISTELGQLSDVALPEGSLVFLNSSSTFIRPLGFSEHQRVVQLSGEAYFEITPDANRPFIIHSNQLITEVLGTKFNVKAYPEEDIISVSVVEGTVRVKRKNLQSEEWVVIEAGEEYLLDHATLKEEVKGFSIDKVLGWREGKFVFESSPLERVLPMLSRKFDVEFVVENEQLNQCKLTAEFQNESLQTILDVISFANDIQYEYLGRKIILKGDGCMR
jgi:transmembrane sensor